MYLRKTARFQVFEQLPSSAALCGKIVLATPDLQEKARLTSIFTTAWARGQITLITCVNDRRFHIAPSPARPFPNPSSFLKLSRNAIEITIHGIAHAESFAIDLFWDLIARFTEDNLPIEFYDDCFDIVAQEGRHFLSWFDRLKDRGVPYGSLPVHDGLWQSAADTAGSLLARLAVINLTHEARGLDTFAITLEKFRKANDFRSIEILEKNFSEEIHHVAKGMKWFQFLCTKRGVDPLNTFHHLHEQFFHGKLKRPINVAARAAAGMTEDYFMPFVES